MAVKDKIICLRFSAFYGNIFPVHICTSSDQQSVVCVCVWPHLHLVLRHKAIPSCPFFAFTVWCFGAEATLFIPVVYLMLVVFAVFEEHKLQNSAAV